MTVPATRKCTKCGETKLSTDFYGYIDNEKRGNGIRGYRLHSQCKKCHNHCQRLSKRRWTKKMRLQKKKRDRRLHLLRDHGISPKEYDSLRRRQKGKCGICGEKNQLHGGQLDVDHDHKTNKIRGLLCHHCNVMLGFAQDSPQRLRQAIAYLEERAA